MTEPNWVPESDKVRAWFEGLGIIVNQTYRVVIDRRRSMMRVWQFALKDGAFIRRGDDIVCRVPFDIRLDEIPDFVTEDRYGMGPVYLSERVLAVEQQ